MMGWSREYSVEVLSRFRSPSGRSDLGGCGRREGMTRLRQGGRLKNKNIWSYGDTALVGVMGHKFKTLIALLNWSFSPTKIQSHPKLYFSVERIGPATPGGHC